MADQRDTENSVVPGWTLLRRLETPGADRAVCLYRKDDLFCFVTERWFGPMTDEDNTILDDAYWAQERRSGLYESLAAAEAAAAVELTAETQST